MSGVKAKLRRYGRDWGNRSLGQWLEIVVGRYRLDLYWEPANGWRTLHAQRWALVAGPLTVIAQHTSPLQDSEGNG